MGTGPTINGLEGLSGNIEMSKSDCGEAAHDTNLLKINELCTYGEQFYGIFYPY